MAVTNMFNRLDDLLARDVVPQWFEGVAVIQLVCRQLRPPGSRARLTS